MAHKIHERRAARESAVALLYSGDISEKSAADIIEDGTYPADDLALSEYAEMLIAGVAEHAADIDERLASVSENWSLDRMPVVDRAILRLATFEIIYVDDVPVSVAINEAVELAKMYGGEDDSSRFVNGVLGRIARSLEEDAGQTADSEAFDALEAPEVLEEDEEPEEAQLSATDDAASENGLTSAEASDGE